LPKPSALKTIPPNILPQEELLGFTEENWQDSFFWSTISILAFYGCTLPASVREFRLMSLKKLWSGILNDKLKDFTFQLNYNNYQQFIENFSKGTVGMDPELYLADALASCLHRPMIFISSLKRHTQRQLFQFNHTSDKPPLIYGIYERKGKEIFYHSSSIATQNLS
jgi:hypothetical protein